MNSAEIDATARKARELTGEAIDRMAWAVREALQAHRNARIGGGGYFTDAIGKAEEAVAKLREAQKLVEPLRQ